MRKLVALDSGTLDLPEEEWSPLREYGELVLHDATAADPELIRERCEGAAVVFTNKVPLRAEVLERLPELRLICVLATGTNNIDHEAAGRQGIAVRNVPGYSTASVVQHTLALLLELTNRVGHYAGEVREGEWIRSRHFSFWHHEIPELAGRTAGIVGFGSIGRGVGAVLHSLGMRVLVHTRTPRDAPQWDGFAFCSDEELFAKADVISLHCPLTEDNEGFVNAQLLRRCRPHCLLVNTARGPLINEEDLLHALREGWIGGAALDVLGEEPMRKDHPLREAANCLITPHQAWATTEARRRLMSITIESVDAFFREHP